jgi:multimeric flavodoxin WrbA
MRRVLAIRGSPRKGDTWHLTQRIEAEMKLLGDVQFDYLWLRDADLATCRGCCACFLGGEERCPLDDDRAEIEGRILSANGVIFASPVYALGMTALMKNLLDRFAYALHRPRFFEQKALIVVSAGAAGVKMTQDALASVRYMGFDLSAGPRGAGDAPEAVDTRRGAAGRGSHPECGAEALPGDGAENAAGAQLHGDLLLPCPAGGISGES